MTCNKSKFRTEIDAEIALEYIRNVRKRHRREKHPVRYYHCEYCNNYHLTSQPAVEEEVELIHVLKFADFLEKQRIQQEMEEMFAANKKTERTGSYKRRAYKIQHGRRKSH